MRPKVSHAWLVSQSGSCSLMDAVRPAIEPTTSHKQANETNMNTGKAVERSDMIRSCNSAGSAMSVSIPPFFTACCIDVCSRCGKAGSSTWPTSPRAKMTEASSGFSLSKPLRSDQMKTNNPRMDSKKAPSRLMTALSIMLSRLERTAHWLRAIGGGEEMDRWS